MTVLVGIVFVATFVLLALRRIGRVSLERGPVALFGGLVMILLGALTPEEAISAIDIGTLLLLLGMMFLAGALAASGFFRLVAGWVSTVAPNERWLVAGTLLTSAILSALFLNDTVALFMPPLLITVLAWGKLPTFRTLAAAALGVNLGSLWTPVGNPQNAYLATVHGIGFFDFVVHMTPLVLLGLLVSGLLLVPGASKAPLPPSPDWTVVERRLPLFLALIALGLTLVLFLFADRLGMPLWTIAIMNGTMVLAMVPLLGKGMSGRMVLEKVNANILLLFVGLFLLLAGARNAGITGTILGMFPLGGATALAELGNIALVTFVLSNLFSNVPAVLLLDPFVSTLHPLYPQVLAAFSTLSGNTTLLASAATLIVAEMSEEQGEPFPFWRFTKIGLVVTVVTLGAAVPYFAWLGAGS